MPSTPELPSGLSDIASDYDALLCDVWGVIHNGVRSFPAAVDALKRARSKGATVILISNSPRPSADVVSQLLSLGVPRTAWSAFVTSGDVTRGLLCAQSSRRMHAIGPERDLVLYAGLDLDLVDMDAADFICCTGLINDETETPEDYRPLLQAAADRRLPMICANPDRVVQRGERLIFCGGALADLYAALGGPVTMAGKPFAPIYAAALAAAQAQIGHELARARVLAIGDGLATDVAGANREGLDCLFIADGIHGAEAVESGDLAASRVAELLAAAGADARYALAALTW